MRRELVAASRRLSLVLRHRPESFGLALDARGWCSVSDLLAAFAEHGAALDRATLVEVVETNDKRRFALSDDGERIRAVQGHSVEVDLDLTPHAPPEILFHGTTARFLAAILREGLAPRGRHHVHLSADVVTARAVGGRRGAPVVLRVAAGEMHRTGHVFLRAENGVWLTASVAPEYLAETPAG